MNPMLNIAIDAARAAGNIIIRNVDRIDRLTIEVKAQNDFVSQVDRKAEEIIIETISKAFPEHSILAEESGQNDKQASDYQWIIDPLDGTTNFLHGFPQFAVSIALKHKNRLEVAVVFDPIKNDLFTAARGQGAKLNDRKIRVTPQKGLKGALLGTGFPFKHPQHLDTYLATFKAVHPDAAGIRRAGSAALDLAYVAAGRLDGFWEIGLNAWDMAAGVLLVREAGGIVTDFSGEGDYLDTGNIIAAAPKLYQPMYELIKPHLTDDLK
ncbi:MAG: inositol-1-monophosphatase [Gammaproteobacteria bacterium]|nr:inositol-1-monophosphatase [Gammaproteobacteria bacterium]MCW8909923.1 inositol-1-monophosphatase [Gammaproteobacteria bacterium]MCW9056084.1 inositol-1-monophosphatase [Gammaproteobacteria bacterium]